MHRGSGSLGRRRGFRIDMEWAVNWSQISLKRGHDHTTIGPRSWFDRDRDWQEETGRSSISHGLVSNIIPNLPILGIYNKLRGIMVNKGRIHRELRYFWDIFWKLIKSDKKLMVEIGENGILWKKTSNRFHVMKNHRIWTWFRGEIANWSGEKFGT